MQQLCITASGFSLLRSIICTIIRLCNRSINLPRETEGKFNLRERLTNWPSYLHAWKTDANQKISHPIDEDRDGHGGGSRTLREQLRRDHPGYGSGPHGEEHDEAQGRHHRDVGHPVDHFLHIAEELLSGSRIVFFFPEQLEEPQDKLIKKKKKKKKKYGRRETQSIKLGQHMWNVCVIIIRNAACGAQLNPV